ncbi:MAG: hypothetical protein MJZ75_01500 [Paludibacteraceae bacterium]|nr:hypothetical protein [Paludibacteraceae bacterium]
MASIKWKYPIESIHGALKKKVFGAAMRKAKNAKGEQPNFSVQYGERDLVNHPITSGENAARARFAAVRALVADRKDDSTKRAQDQAAFKAQSTYTTLSAYLWHVCGQEYDSAQD